MADQTINNMTVIWNSGATTFAGIKMNVTDTASAVGSMLIQLQVGGSDKFKVGKDGSITGAGPLSIAGNATITGNLTVSGTLTATGIAGTVTGPASSTNNAIARFNGTTGGVLKNSGVTIDDSGNLTSSGNLVASGNVFSRGNVFEGGTAGAILQSQNGSPNTIYLRPNANSATGQLSVATTGAVTINGTLTVTG